jgi:hypothetical protein
MTFSSLQQVSVKKTREELTKNASQGVSGAAARRDVPNPLVFPRNVPSRSTFHSGELESRRAIV